MKTAIHSAWQPGFSLVGERVALVPLSASHAEGMVAASAEGDLWQIKVTRVPGAHDVDDYIGLALTQRDAGEGIPFAITLRETGEVIGCTRYWELDEFNRKAEIGHTWIGRRWQGTFVNPEMKFLMLRYAFETMGCYRVQLKTNELNTHSQAAIARLGAVREGVLRHERLMPDGSKRNAVMFSIIDPEWPDVSARLKARLAELGLRSYQETVTLPG
ncbi:MAG: GNAT family N-acetyltransferase [Burkholderiales bacterium]|nr:GNAT family N-acetyltransferase [Burkholderiales bacterium]